MSNYTDARTAWTHYLTNQYNDLLASLSRQYQLHAAGVHMGCEHVPEKIIPPPTPRDWAILEGNWNFLADVAGVEYALGLTASGNRRRKKLSDRALARRQIAKGNAARMVRKHENKKGYRVYRWTAYGDARDYLCSRYVDKTFSSAYTLPVPGTSMEMNDSHINCQCVMEYVGMAGMDGRPREMQEQYERYIFDTGSYEGAAP